MASLNYYSYPGMGEFARINLNYAQAVRINGNASRIECSGQGGWMPDRTDKPVFPTNLKEEIAQAFANVDLNLKNAGGKGWTQVFRVNSYHTEITPEASAHFSIVKLMLMFVYR